MTLLEVLNLLSIPVLLGSVIYMLRANTSWTGIAVYLAISTAIVFGLNHYVGRETLYGERPTVSWVDVYTQYFVAALFCAIGRLIRDLKRKALELWAAEKSLNETTENLLWFATNADKERDEARAELEALKSAPSPKDAERDATWKALRV